MNKYSTEQLASISREDLEREFLAVRSAINIAKRNREDARELEIYYCYVSREYQTRERMKGLTSQR